MRPRRAAVPRRAYAPPRWLIVANRADLACAAVVLVLVLLIFIIRLIH